MTAGVDSGLLQAYADAILRCRVNVDQGQKVLPPQTRHQGHAARRERCLSHRLGHSAHDRPAETPEDDVAHGVNRSRIHQDAMIGGPEISVPGVTAGGDEVPVIVADAWRLAGPAAAE